MSKLSQLRFFKELNLPTPDFIGLSWDDFQTKKINVSQLKSPLAIRSTFNEEDGNEKSYAGHFETILHVEKTQLEDAISKVFNSYPKAEGNEVIIQEMIEPDYSGVLFAFQKGIWKLEVVKGLGENLVSGKHTPEVILLPKFKQIDTFFSSIWKIWPGLDSLTKKENQALIQLAVYTRRLLQNMNPDHGLDIEFAIVKGKVFLLQSRPITTPEEAEEVLTSANHKEILPPVPSRFMTDLTHKSGPLLFDYYRMLDPSLPARSFIEKSGEMPWINLSALLDLMVHWGLPTYLVGDSVGAQDVYKVRIRPYVMVTKLTVFLKALWQQWIGINMVMQWIERNKKSVIKNRKGRLDFWQKDPGKAYEEWLSEFQQLYVDLVSHMQRLTGAMSGPMYVLQRLGLLGKLAAASQRKSASMDYLRAISDLQTGNMSQEAFLEEFGHRGFYESDLGQARFWEYTQNDWEKLIPKQVVPPAQQNAAANPTRVPFWTKWLASWLFRHVHARENLRHEAMKFFWSFRAEIKQITQESFGQDLAFWQYNTNELNALFKGQKMRSELDDLEHPTPSGWDMDTFLSNGLGRRLPVDVLSNIQGKSNRENGIGIYPGKVRGRVWRVNSASMSEIKKPAFDKTILVADALDPGWMPYFTQVDGVISYIGGLLSHASIVLRESGVPSITQLPSNIVLNTGDWIEMDGRTGKVLIERDSNLK